MKANKQIMGENIQRYLDEKGMTRKELAEALGLLPHPPRRAQKKTEPKLRHSY